MKIAAVIVTYNRAEALIGTLRSTLAQSFDVVVVVDNASTDRTQDVLGTVGDDRLKVIRLEDNLGGAGGFHAGVKLASETADWAVLFDDDSWPDAGCIDRFRSFDIAPEVAVVSASVFYPDGKICEMNRQGLNPFWHIRQLAGTMFPSSNGRAGFKLTDQQIRGTDLVEVDNASFVGFFLRLDAARTEGLPRPELFIYGDDVLYSLFLRRKGWKIVVAPMLRFVHDCGTMGEGFVYRPLWKVYYHCRNGVDIARMASGPVIFPMALLYYVLLWWRRGRNAKDRGTYYRLMRMGLCDGLLKRFGRNDAAHKISNLAE